MKVKRTTLTTRSKAKELFKEFDRSDSSVLDLTKVNFMSRSFADEFLKQLESRDVRVETNSTIEEILNAVEDTNKSLEA